MHGANWPPVSAKIGALSFGGPALQGALAAITAAVVGVIANLALWFALHVLFREVSPVLASFDWRSGVIALVAVGTIFAWKRGIVITLAVCGALGFALGLGFPL